MSRRTLPTGNPRPPRMPGAMRDYIAALDAIELTERERQAWAMYGVLSEWSDPRTVVIRPGPGLAVFLYVAV